MVFVRGSSLVPRLNSDEGGTLQAEGAVDDKGKQELITLDPK